MLLTRRTTLFIAGAVLLLLGAAVLAVSRLDVDRYRGRVQAALAERLHRDVSIGPMRVSLRPFGVRVENGVIGEDPAFHTERPFAQAEELYATLSPLALLRGRIDLRSVELRQPAIELVRNAAGVWNFTSLGGDGLSDGVLLKHFLMTGGQVAVTDLATSDTRRAVYQNVDLTLTDYAAGRAFDLMLAANLPGTGAQRLVIRGEAGPIAKSRFVQTPFAGEAQFDEVSISALQRYLQVEALQEIDAVLTGSAGLTSREGRMSSQGSLRFDRALVHGVDIGYPVTATFDLAHDANTGRLTIRPTTVRLDQTPVSIDGTIDFERDTSLLDLHVKASDAPVEESARLASALGIAFGSGTNVQGRFTADVHARGPASRPAFDGHVRLRGASISGKDLPKPVRTPAIDIAMTPKEIRSNDFIATSDNTSVTVRFALADYTTETPTIDATIRAVNAELGDALNVAHAWGVHAADGLAGSGRVTLNVRATGPARALNYTGNAAVRDAAIRTPSLAQALRVGTADVTFASNMAVLDNVTAAVGSTKVQGRLTVRNFASPDVNFQLSADRMDVAELQNLLAPARQMQAGGPRQRRDSTLLRMTGSGRLRVSAIRYNELLLENAQADARLDHGVITIQPLTASLFGGQHRGSVVIDARRSPTAFTVASDLQKVDANRLASAATSLKDVVYGALDSSDRVTFTTDGSANIAPSLNGTLALNIPDGRIAHMDLMHEIGALARFIRGDDGDQQHTKIRNLTAHFTVTNGVAHTADLTATIDNDATIGGTGSISLVTQALNLRLTAVLSREFSDIVGGTGVGGIMATALANRRGELVVPMLVTGTMRQPRFAPDVERIAEMKLRNLVPDIRDPRKLSTAMEEIFGTITGGSARLPTPPQPRNGEDDQAPPPPTRPERGDPAKQIEDTLRQLLGGWGTKEQQPAK